MLIPKLLGCLDVWGGGRSLMGLGKNGREAAILKSLVSLSHPHQSPTGKYSEHSGIFLTK